MPKEIANKTKGEIHPIRELAVSNGASYKCTHCGDEIFWNTHKKFIYPIRELNASNGASCKCKKIWVDGCEFTPLDTKFTRLDTRLSNGVKSNGEIVRVGGNEKDRKMIKK